MNIFKRCNLAILITSIPICFSVSAMQSPIEVEYNAYLEKYNSAIKQRNYDDACLAAEKLLSMDSSDAFSLLRLSYCSEKLDAKYKKVVELYWKGVARSNKQEIEILDFIKVINSSK
jgi:hypothetical protein